MLDWNELRNWNEYFKLIVGLLAIMGPLAVVPTFLSLTSQYTGKQKRHIAGITMVSVVITLLSFTFFGSGILNLFAIKLSAFRIAGGLLLLFLSFDMMRSRNDSAEVSQSDSARSAVSLAIIPLGIPLLAGPGAISTVIIYAAMHNTLSHKILVALVIIIVSVIVLFVLRISTRTEKFVGPTSMMVFNQVMGLIIAAVAIEFILDGLIEHLPRLGAT